MGMIYCPICNRRVCDSDKALKIAKLSNSNRDKADIIIKCSNCKNSLSIKMVRNAAGHRTGEPPPSGSF